jgi:hypothetical protein
MPYPLGWRATGWSVVGSCEGVAQRRETGLGHSGSELAGGHKGKDAAHPASHAAAHTLTPLRLMPLIYMSG